MTAGSERREGGGGKELVGACRILDELEGGIERRRERETGARTWGRWRAGRGMRRGGEACGNVDDEPNFSTIVTAMGLSYGRWPGRTARCKKVPDQYYDSIRRIIHNAQSSIRRELHPNVQSRPWDRAHYSRCLSFFGPSAVYACISGAREREIRRRTFCIPSNFVLVVR